MLRIRITLVALITYPFYRDVYYVASSLGLHRYPFKLNPSFSDAITPKDTAPPIGNAASGAYLWRSTLDSYNREILECARCQFLDLDKALRLDTINARDPVNLLAKAERLGHRETDVI